MMHPRTFTGPRLAARLSLFALIAASPAYLLGQPPAAPAQPTTPAATPAADLPSPQSIIDHFIEATGGRAAYEKITTRTSVGKFEVPAQGIAGQLRIDQAAPNKMRVIVEVPNIGKIDSGTNGEIAWVNTSMTGPKLVDGAEREQTLRDAIFNSVLHSGDIYPKMETIGLETVDGHACYKVVLTPASGSAKTAFYDKESGLLIKTQSIEHSQMGDIPTESFPSEWKDVDGVKQPYVTVIKAVNMEQRLVFDKIEQNTELPADAFEPPADVKELASKPKPEPKPETPPATPEQPKTPTSPKPNTPESPK